MKNNGGQVKNLVLFCALLAFCKVSEAALIETDCPPPLDCTVTYGEADAVHVEPLKAPVKATKKPKLLASPQGKSVLVRGTDIIELRDLARQAAIEIPDAVPVSERKGLSPRKTHIRPRKAVVNDGRVFTNAGD